MTQAKTHLTIRQRLLIGGVGALSPQLANLLVVDLEQVLVGATAVNLFVYVIRVCALAAIGVLIAYLHDDESSKVKVFQFGLAAPAMLLATINGRELALRGKPTEATLTRPVSDQGVWAMNASMSELGESGELRGIDAMACGVGSVPLPQDELVLAAPPMGEPIRSAATAE